MKIDGNVIFIADVHLGISEEVNERVRKFLKFLPRDTTIVSLGDFVDLWTEGNTYDLSDKYFLLSELKARKTIFLRGNRDFLIGSRWEKITGGKIIDEPAEIFCNGIKIITMHGDALMKNDLRYQIWRKICRNYLFQQTAKCLPKNAALLIASGIKKAISADLSIKNKRELSIDLNKAELFLSESDIVIFGHSHIPMHKVCANGNIYTLGSWDKNGESLYISANGKIQFVKPEDVTISET